MRMRSPRRAPPENGLVGSTAMIPTRAPARRYSPASFSTRVLFPAPGDPVTPMTSAFPEAGNSLFKSSVPSVSPASTAEIARAMARRSRASTFAAQVWIESAMWWQGPPWFRPSVSRAVTMRWMSPVPWSRTISPESRLYHKPCSVKKLAAHAVKCAAGEGRRKWYNLEVWEAN